MPTGGCLCGAVKFEYTGEPQVKALCHCTDCRKISGSTYSTNIIVPEEGFSVTSGKPKSYTKKSDSGREITSQFCGDCGSTLFRDGAAFPGAKVVKVGVMDDMDALDNAKPAVELYAPQRVNWVPATGNADQAPGMPN